MMRDASKLAYVPVPAFFTIDPINACGHLCCGRAAFTFGYSPSNDHNPVGCELREEGLDSETVGHAAALAPD